MPPTAANLAIPGRFVPSEKRHFLRFPVGEHDGTSVPNADYFINPRIA
jgi:hypothetical protein